MTEAVLAALGGIGLFLFGMQTMTAALTALAGRRTRAVLARFTTSPLRGVLAGAAATAVLQSSSATVLTVIGFVGAGLLTFPQALGVVFGANIGTTVTGWMVAVLGLKVGLGTLAMPLSALGALAAAAGGRAVAAWGRMATGFALVFLGLDMMKAAAPAVEPLLAGVLVPADTLAGRLILVAAGCAVTAVVQSSSVGVAMALVLMASGAIGLLQAAALVIGMDLGTTLKSLLATLGGSRDMRRTAWAHVGYNIATAMLAFAALGLVPFLPKLTAGDAQTALVFFHTAFNVAGVVVLLPVLPLFARAIGRLVPGDGPLAEALSPALAADPAAATDTARAVAVRIAGAAFAGLAVVLRGGAPARGEEAEVHRAIEDLEAFLIMLAPPAPDEAGRRRLAALMHLADHLHRLTHRAGQADRIATLATEAPLRRPARAMAAMLERVAAHGPDAASAARLERLHDLVARRAARLRRSVLLREHAGMIGLGDVFVITDAARWLERSLRHAERITHYAVAAGKDAPGAAEAARSVG